MDCDRTPDPKDQTTGCRGSGDALASPRDSGQLSEAEQVDAAGSRITPEQESEAAPGIISAEQGGQAKTAISKPNKPGDSSFPTYWDGLAKGFTWVDYTGASLLVAGVAYFFFWLFLFRELDPPLVPLKILGKWLSAPISVVLCIAGITCIVGPLKRRIAIPCFKGMLRVYTAMGLLLTSLGLMVHQAATRVTMFLAVSLAVFLTLFSYAATQAKWERKDDLTRVEVINFLDRHHLSTASRPRVIDLLEATKRHDYPGRAKRSTALVAVLDALAFVYYAADPTAEMDEAQFLEDVEHRATEMRRLLNSTAVAASPPLDRLLYHTTLLSFLNLLSFDGMGYEHARNAVIVAKAGLAVEEDAQSFGQHRGLPALFSFRNGVGVSFTNYALGGPYGELSSEERAEAVRVAYESYERAETGPMFCQARRINNLIDLELKLLRGEEELLAEVLAQEGPLADAIEKARANPSGWYKQRSSQLQQIAKSLRLPEVHLTYLQLASLYARWRHQSLGPPFCDTEEFQKIEIAANQALRGAFTLGFSTCEFFHDPSETGIQLVNLCPRKNGGESLCDVINEGFAWLGFQGCQPCATN